MQILFTIAVLCFLGILWAALALARHIKVGQFHARDASVAPPVPRQHQLDFKQHLLSILPPADASPDAYAPAAFEASPVLSRSMPRTQQTPFLSIVPEREAVLPLTAAVPSSAVPSTEAPHTNPADIAAQSPQPAPILATLTASAAFPTEATPLHDPNPTSKPSPVPSVKPLTPLTLIPVAMFTPAASSRRSLVHGLNQSVHDIAANKQWILPPHPTRMMRLPLQRIGRPRKAAESVAPVDFGRKPPQAAARNGAVKRLDPAYFNKDMGDLTDPYQPQRRVNERNR